MYENFVGTLETVRNREVSVLERCPYREVRRYVSQDKRQQIFPGGQEYISGREA